MKNLLTIGKEVYYALFLLLFYCLTPCASCALEPSEILVVVNKRMPKSIDIAKYYMEKRSIPESHLLQLSLSLKETISRQEYDEMLKGKILKKLIELSSEPRISTLVLIYGMPLKVEPSELSWDDKKEVRQFRKKKKDLLQLPKPIGEKVKLLLKVLTDKISVLTRIKERASVDSELALLEAEPYTLSGWVKNPYFLGFKSFSNVIPKDKVLLVSRLDGPDASTVYRIIDDTLSAERYGLKGKAYVDARWSFSESETGSGYKFYDASLHKAAQYIEKRMEVVIDDKESLFEENCCKEAALYCGWYSLSRYIDSFEWQPGSIGYHMASNECSTLKNAESSVWCLKMLQNGIAAVIGPVYEPYIQGFPVPELFFSHLVEGYMSLGEAYLVSIPYLSWQMILVGDPLYQPFSPVKEP
jgi:uncharacterized protein (TIGR03790 family)